MHFNEVCPRLMNRKTVVQTGRKNAAINASQSSWPARATRVDRLSSRATLSLVIGCSWANETSKLTGYYEFKRRNNRSTCHRPKLFAAPFYAHVTRDTLDSSRNKPHRSIVPRLATRIYDRIFPLIGIAAIPRKQQKRTQHRRGEGFHATRRWTGSGSQETGGWRKIFTTVAGFLSGGILIGVNRY